MSARRGIAGSLFATVFGFMLGAVGGIVAGEWIGDVSQDRIRRGLSRLRRSGSQRPPPQDAPTLARAVLDALRSDPQTRSSKIAAHAIDDGTVEITGWVNAEDEREHARRIARRTAGVKSVINRVLVRNVDGKPPGSTASEAAKS